MQPALRLPETPPAIMPDLNNEQTSAVEQIVKESQVFKAWLLHGITGSGKTEVYIRLIQHVLQEKNAQVLVLVPEINLTPQLEARFRSRLPNFPLVSLHSNLSESERLHLSLIHIYPALFGYPINHRFFVSRVKRLLFINCVK